MPTVRVTTHVAAAADVAFDLARSVDLHVTSMSRYHERAVAGVTSGLIGPGEEVTWRARHLLLPFTLTSRITRFDRPRSFRDSMVRGSFTRFDHDHLFEQGGGGTQMTDVVVYELPYGLLGRAADVVVRRRLLAVLTARQAAVKHAAERRAGLTAVVDVDPQQL